MDGTVEGTNGEPKRICPFYNTPLDVESLRRSMDALRETLDKRTVLFDKLTTAMGSQQAATETLSALMQSEIKTLLDRATSHVEGVPLKTHLITVLALLVSFFGIETFKMFMRG